MTNSEGTRPIRVGKRGERLRESRSMVMIQSWDCDVSMARQNEGKENERRERGQNELDQEEKPEIKGRRRDLLLFEMSLAIIAIIGRFDKIQIRKKNSGDCVEAEWLEHVEALAIDSACCPSHSRKSWMYRIRRRVQNLLALC